MSSDSDELHTMYKQMKVTYAKYVVENVRPLWLEGVDPHAIYPQECFYRAYCYATDASRYTVKGLWLVHGECAFALGPHAWVELPDGLIFDGVFQQFFRAKDFYDRGKLVGQPWYRFTPRAASLIAANMPMTDDGRCSYRWDGKLKLPWITDEPLEIDFEKADELIVASGIRAETIRQRSMKPP